MPSAHDVAKYLLRERGPMTAMRLQKLLYYSQAWSLVWDERPLFDERIEAWANGPVVPEVYEVHRGQFTLRAWPQGRVRNLDENARDTIDRVAKFYKKYNAQQLSDLTHMEGPWKDARKGLPDGSRGSTVITHASMAEYYGSL